MPRVEVTIHSQLAADASMRWLERRTRAELAALVPKIRVDPWVREAAADYPELIEHHGMIYVTGADGVTPWPCWFLTVRRPIPKRHALVAIYWENAPKAQAWPDRDITATELAKASEPAAWASGHPARGGAQSRPCA